MTQQVIILPQAMDDIVRNATWWAEHHSPEQALHWYESILAHIKAMAFPASHPIAAENDAFPFELRELHFGLGSRPGYRILFRIIDDAVEVLTVKAAEEDLLRADDLKS